MILEKRRIAPPLAGHTIIRERYSKGEMMFRQRKAQSTLEYVILVTIILGVCVAMGNYFKRGVQWRWKGAVDDLGEQYDPRVTNAGVRYILEANSITVVTSVPAGLDGKNGFWTMRTDQTNSLETKTGRTAVGAF